MIQSFLRWIAVAFFVFAWPAACLAIQEESAEQTEAEKKQQALVIKILDDYIEALGGEMTLDGIETLKHDFEYKEGTVATGTQQFKDQKVLCVGEYENYGKHAKLFYGGRWYRANRDETPVPVGGQGSEDTAAMFHHGPIFAVLLRNNAKSLSIVPAEEYSDTEFAKCLCLRTKEVQGSHLKRFFDPETGLLVAIQRWHRNEGAPGPIKRLQSTLEYKEAEGVMVVNRSIRSNDNGWRTECLFTNFQFNVDIDDAVFELGQIEPDDD